MKLKSLINTTMATLLVVITALGISSCTTDDVTSINDGGTPSEEGEKNVVIFDFTSSDELTNLGVSIPGNGSGTPIPVLKKLSATITPTNGDGNPARIWATNSGVLDLRVYNNDALTFSVPDGFVITHLSWTSANADNIDAWKPNAGSVSGGVWTAEEGKTYSSITLTATATTRINVLTFGYAKGEANSVAGDPEPEPEPEPDPIVPVTVTLDFTSADAVTSMGITIPANSDGTPLSAPIVSELLTVNYSNAEGANPIRVWATKSGVLDLRSYKGDALTFSVPDDYYIKALSWTSANAESIDSWTPSEGSLSQGVWAIPDGQQLSSVQFTATGTARINVITVTYEKRQ